jgi:hypothetical protein
MHAAGSVLLLDPSIVRQRRHLLVPAGKRLSGWWIVRPDQRWRSRVSLGVERFRVVELNGIEPSAS